MERRWTEGCRNAARLWRELVDAGFSGRLSTVRAWATERRRREPATSVPGSLEGQTWPPPSVRRTARLLLVDHEISAVLDRAFIARLLAEAPALRAAADAARRIGRLLRREGEDRLDDILDEAAATPLGSFVTELRKDIAAVQAAIDLP